MNDKKIEDILRKIRIKEAPPYFTELVILKTIEKEDVLLKIIKGIRGIAYWMPFIDMRYGILMR
ncbi:MAG: hypothetical protein AB1297_07210 [bacterium]